VYKRQVLRKKVNPDLVLLPARCDIHQDHQTISAEGIRAFNKTSSIFGYESMQNTTNFRPNIFVEIKPQHFFSKMKSSNCYKSQVHRPYFKSGQIASVAIMRGGQMGVEMAEAFEAIGLKI